MSVDALTDLVNKLAAAQLSTEDKLQTLTNSVDTLVRHNADSQGPAAGNTRSPTPATPVGPELQNLARQVQDKYKSVTLDSNHKLHEDRAGVRREDQKTLNVISRSGRFVETGLKIIQSANNPESDGTLSSDKASELYTVLLAHLAYLQDEYGCVFVGSLGDQTTAKIFRQLRKNTSALPSDAIADLRAAAQVAASFPQPPRQAGPGTYPWHGPRSRGGYRTGNPRGRGLSRPPRQPQFRFPPSDPYARLADTNEPPI